MIDGVILKALARHNDERGFFVELIRKSDPFFSEGFGQLSRSSMVAGVVKAWHIHKTQVDWWCVVMGEIRVALFDMRPDSTTYKTLQELTLDGDTILKIPPGVAHGLKVTTERAELVYVTSGTYAPEEEGRIPYNDPNIGYDWHSLGGIAISNKKIT